MQTFKYSCINKKIAQVMQIIIYELTMIDHSGLFKFMKRLAFTQCVHARPGSKFLPCFSTTQPCVADATVVSMFHEGVSYLPKIIEIGTIRR